MLPALTRKIKGFAARLGQHILPLTGLLALSAVTYLSVFDPVIFADDWDLYRKYLFGQEFFFNLASRRPLEELGIKLFLAIFGVNLPALFLATVLVLFLTAAAAYFLTRRIFPKFPLLAFLCAGLLLVYPVDYTRMWFTQVDHWMIYGGTLLALTWFWDYALEGRLWKLIAGLMVILVSLAIYEAPFGLAVAGAVLIAVLLPRVPLRRRAALFLPLALGFLYLIWRLVIRTRLLHIQDPYLSGIDLSLIGTVKNLLGAFPVFVQAWVLPFQFYLPETTLAKLLAILAGFSVCCGVLALAVTPAGQDGDRPAWKQKLGELPSFLVPFGLGLALLVAGYIPVIWGGGPNLNLNGGSTRANMYAIYGGALALASLAGAAALFFSRSRVQIPALAFSFLLPFFMAGAVQQIWNQNETKLAWREEQVFWHNLFWVVPNLRSDATLVVVSQESYPTKPFERLSLSVEWEVMHGLRVLYNDPALKGTIYFPQFNRGGSRETRFAPDGVHGYDLALIPYDKMVIVIYTPANGVIQVVKDPVKELGLDFPVQGYDPGQFMLKDPPPKTPYRSLVH